MLEFIVFLSNFSAELIFGSNPELLLLNCLLSSMLLYYGEGDLGESEGDGLLLLLRLLLRIGSFVTKLVSYDLAFGVGTSSFFP